MYGSIPKLGGYGGMLPQENLEITRQFLVASDHETTYMYMYTNTHVGYCTYNSFDLQYVLVFKEEGNPRVPPIY